MGEWSSLLGNRKSENCLDLVEELIQSYKILGFMSLNLRFLHSHSAFFSDNLGWSFRKQCQIPPVNCCSGKVNKIISITVLIIVDASLLYFATPLISFFFGLWKLTRLFMKIWHEKWNQPIVIFFSVYCLLPYYLLILKLFRLLYKIPDNNDIRWVNSSYFAVSGIG